LSNGLSYFVTAATPSLPEGVTDNGNGTYTVVSGTELTIEAIANSAEHYYFDNWTNEQGSEYTTGVVTPTGPRPATSLLTLTITGDTTVRGNFRIDTFDLTLSTNNANMGHIDIGGQQYESKDTMLTDHQHIDVAAIPKSGYYFVNWTDANGIEKSKNTHIMVTAISDTTLTANFAPYAILQIASNYNAWGTVALQAGTTGNHELTLYDESESTSNHLIPAYTCWFDALTRSQHVIPATKLAEVKGGTISSIKYYAQDPVSWTSNKAIDVYLKEVTNTTLNSLVDKSSCTVVYNGQLNVVDGIVTITFSSPFSYNGGNLLVGIENLEAGNYNCGVRFLGEDVPGASIGGQGGNFTQQDFLPMSTFTYQTAGAIENTDGSYSVIPGTEVTVTATVTATPAENFHFVNWTDENSNVMGTDVQITLTITGDTTVQGNFDRDFEGSGTEDDPYLIPSKEKWNLMATRVYAGNSYEGKYFRQTADINQTNLHRVGNGYPFSGIYDGQGHSIPLAMPFYIVDGATIKNLHIKGTVGAQFYAGLIYRINQSDKTTNIINCRSSIEIRSNASHDYDGTNGGFVGVTKASINFIGCVFDGKFVGENGPYCRSNGGFIGWTEKEASVYFKDCIFAPELVSMGDSLSCTFSRARKDTSLHFTNCYYTQAYGTEQGKQMDSITAGEYITSLTFAGVDTVYNVSGITAYANNMGLKYGDKLYAGNGDVVELSLSHADRTADGFTFNSYSASNGGTINGSTLTMPDTSTVINANYNSLPTLTLASNDNTMGTVALDGMPAGVTIKDANAGEYYVVPGTTVTVKATANTGHLFEDWTNENSNVMGTNEQITLTVTGDTTVQGNFVLKTYTVRVVGTPDREYGSAQITDCTSLCQEILHNENTNEYKYTVNHGTTITVTATPTTGHHFAAWEGGITATTNPLEIVIDRDTTISAYFEVNTYSVTANSEGHGSVEINGAGLTIDGQHGKYGGLVTFTATPDAGYRFVQWNDGNTDNPRDTIIHGEVHLTATFAPNTPGLTPNGELTNQGNRFVNKDGEIVSTPSLGLSGAIIENSGGTTTSATGHALTSAVVGEIIGSDGLAYAATDKDNLPSGVTAVAMVAYVGNESNCEHGLAIALSDESDRMHWSDAVTACTNKNTSAPFNGGTWRLPTIVDWQNMFIGCGASGSVISEPNVDQFSMDYTYLTTKLSAAGGNGVQNGDEGYWSGTGIDSDHAWALSFFSSSNALFLHGDINNVEAFVRTCLAF
jgi:hypothetical protein